MLENRPPKNLGWDDLSQSLYLKLISNRELWQQDLSTALAEICRSVWHATQVTRVSVWSLTAEGLYCLNNFSQNEMSPGHRNPLRYEHCNKLIHTLTHQRLLDIQDVTTDPLLRECLLSESTVQKPDALLGAGVWQQGELRGMITLEQTGGARLWSKEEKQVLLAMSDLTGQLMLHYELQKSSDYYDSLLGNMPSTVYRCDYDEDWTMHYISPGITALSGYPPGDFINNRKLSYGSIIHPDDRKLVAISVDTAIKKNRDFEMEYRIRHKDGSIRWVNEIGRAIHNLDGSLAFLSGVINNITEQRRAEEQLENQRNIVYQVSTALSLATGDQFFRKLTQELVKVMQVDYAFIGKYIQKDIKKISTLASFRKDHHQPNFSFLLEGTPCQEVLESGVCCYPRNIQQHFPNDRLLCEMQIEGYLGTPLHDSNGNILGIMVVMSENSLTNTKQAAELLTIFAVRAGAELERQLAEHSLRQSQQHYKNLFDSAGDAILIIKDNGILDCNQSTLKLFACQRDEIIGHSPVDLSPEYQPDGQPSRAKALAQLRNAFSGITQQFEWVHTRMDGTPIYTEVTLNRIESGEEYLLLGVIRDISERKQAEEIIQKQDEQLRASIEAMPGIFYITDATGHVVQCNNAYLDLYGLTHEELKNHNALDYIHPDDLPHARASLRRVLENRESVRFEIRVISGRGQGPLIHILATGSCTVLEGKRYIVGAAIDITERVVAEERIESYQITLHDRNQSLQILNILASRLHGVHDEEKIHTTCAQSLAELPGNPTVLILIPDLHKDILNAAYSANLPSGIHLSRIKVPMRNSLSGQALLTGLVQHQSISPDNPHPAMLSQHNESTLLNSRTQLCIPVINDTSPVAVISILYKETRSFTQLDLNTMESIGKNLAAAIINARHAKVLEHQALHDSLTGLPNRSALHNELNRINDNSMGIALMLIDLDRFKEVNDTLGHSIGDRLICTIGPRIIQVLQYYDMFLSRLGGDEFALVMRNINDINSVKHVAELVLNAIRRPFEIDEVTLELGASIGIAVHDQPQLDSHELLRQSDVAMYHAKQTTSGFCVYKSEIDTHSREKLAMMSNLRSAISDDQFVLYYQPKYDIKQNTITGFEALLRWQHPEQGLIYPDQFIDLVEMSDLIHPITELVIRKAIIQLSEWHRHFNTSCSIAVNISTRNLLDLDFPRQLEQVLEETGFDPTLLELEITESALISDPVRSLDILNAITALGVRLSIDDFGTGYSSLAYLKQLPIQTLKIDRSFVMDMQNNKQDELIVNSTVTLAHNLGLQVVAEGVENAEVLNKLNQMRCDYAQGYHFSRPLPPEELIQTLLDKFRNKTRSEP